MANSSSCSTIVDLEIEQSSEATSPLQSLRSPNNVDFRYPYDEAWYPVRLLKVEEGFLRVMYLNFPEECDEWYCDEQFESVDQIQELIGRFRLPAQKLQDSQCGEISPGMVVLASRTFLTGRKRCDAMVDSVTRSEHICNGTLGGS